MTHVQGEDVNGGPVRVSVDADRCVGSSTCVGLAPDHFRMGDAGVAEPVRELAPPDDALVEAEESCPVAAIRFRAP